MGRFRYRVPSIIVFILAIACIGCGGGYSSQPTLPPPPTADFALGLSVSNVTLVQGGSAAVNVSVSGSNGFNSTVQVSLSGLPANVSSSPASPFSVTPAAAVPVIFVAGANAATGNFTVAAQGSSGSLSHSATLALAIQSAQVLALPRTAYIRTDSTFAMDNPFGEPHHRHMAYDGANKHVFIANRAMNRVEVISTTDQTIVARISVPGASSADLSVDGSTVWVGTALQEIVAIDAGSLRVKTRYPVTGLVPNSNRVFNRPAEVLAVANSKFFVRLRQAISSQALLAFWDPASNSFSDLTSSAPQLFQNGVGTLARSGDHTKMLVASNDSSGDLALYDSAAHIAAGPLSLGSGLISRVAANSAGTRFAAAFTLSDKIQLLLLDANLNIVSSYAAAAVHGISFSRDGKFLYLSETASNADVITVLDGLDAHVIGQVPAVAIQSVPPDLEESGDTQLLFAIANRGISLIDAATPATLPAPAPSFALAPSLSPSEGRSVGGEQTVLAGQNFTSVQQVNFGAHAATKIATSSSTQIQATTPPSVTSAAVNVTAYFSTGWLSIAPDGFSYAPQILIVTPNAGSSVGGDTVQIYGYGFGTDASQLNVKFAGTVAAVQKVENVSAIASSLGFDSSYPFSLERITVQTPAGTPGKADISINSPAGGVASAKAFQFLKSLQSYSKPGLYKFLLYDQKRQWIYLSNTDHLDVFDLAGAQFHTTGLFPPGGPPPNATLRGICLTPGGSQLAIADFGSQKVYLLNPDSGSGTSVSVGGVPGFLNSGPARVAATSTQTVFVGLSGEGGSSTACSSCLGQLDLTATPLTIQPAPQPEVTSLTGAPILVGNTSGDRVFLSFGATPGGPVALWDASAPNQFTLAAANPSTRDLGAAADGTMFALQANNGSEIRGADLLLASVPVSSELQQIPGRIAVPGIAFHPSGALIYQPFLTASPAVGGARGGIDILDARSGVLRLRIFLPQAFMTDIDALHGSFLTTNETGQKLFALTSSDGSPQNAALTVVELASVPLGIGTIAPAATSAAGGEVLTIRGSGYQSKTIVTLGGHSAGVSFTDPSTLSIVAPPLLAGPQQLIITNPDGESVSLDAAVTVN